VGKVEEDGEVCKVIGKEFGNGRGKVCGNAMESKSVQQLKPDELSCKKRKTLRGMSPEVTEEPVEKKAME